jgi:Protein of unknown function (DUF1302)
MKGMTSHARLKKNRMSVGVAAALACWAVSANAMPIFADNPDWTVNWDNTVSYNLGMRAQGVDSGIGNNPAFSESDYKFSHAGDIVTNRVSDLSEFDAEFQNKFGFRVSGSFWKDFAYGSGVNNNPNDFAPGVPYTALNSYSNNRYSSFTERYYQDGAELLDAFAFYNFNIGNAPSSIKVGRLTQFWGNALFFNGLSYGQNGEDGIKGSSVPGTQLKELMIPRAQVLFQTDVTPTVSLAAQYFAEFQPTLFPQGGTYLGTAGFLTQGPNLLEGQVPQGAPIEPNVGFHNDYGFKATWSPQWLNGTMGFYYRNLTETQPWVLLGVNPLTGATNYHLSYASDVHLYGFSLDKQIGPYSAGLDVSYRQHTALNSSLAPLPSDLSGQEGARGDVLNVIGNVLAGLTRTPFWDTGSAIFEIAYQQKIKVTSNAAMYEGVDNSLACPSGSKWQGCSTNSAVAFAFQFDPQWLQVYPGVDLDAPLFVEYGLYGNQATTFGSPGQGQLQYTIGVHALIQNKYNVTLQYNGYHAHAGGIGNANGPATYNGGNGTYFYNDRNWLSLTFSSTF